MPLRLIALLATLVLGSGLQAENTVRLVNVTPDRALIQYRIDEVGKPDQQTRIAIYHEGTLWGYIIGLGPMQGQYEFKTQTPGAYFFRKDMNVTTSFPEVQVIAPFDYFSGQFVEDLSYQGKVGQVLRTEGEIIVEAGAKLSLENCRFGHQHFLARVNGLLILKKSLGGSLWIQGTGRCVLEDGQADFLSVAEVAELTATRMVVQGYIPELEANPPPANFQAGPQTELHGGLVNLVRVQNAALLSCAVSGSGVYDRNWGYSEFNVIEDLLVQSCDFDGDVRLRLTNSVAVALRSSVFRAKVYFTHAPGQTISPPEVTGNTFLQGAEFGVQMNGYLASSPLGWLRCPGNYWGDYSGILTDQSPAQETGWLDRYALNSASVRDPFPRTAGSYRASGLSRWPAFPVIWVEQTLIGQNMLGAAAPRPRCGRPVLFTFDVRANVESLRNVKFTLECNGAEYAWAGTTLRRDYWGWSDNGPLRTVNFLVPASAADRLDYTLYADSTGTTGYVQPGGRVAIATGSQSQAPGFGRPLRLGVVSVRVGIPGYTPNVGPNLESRVVNTLESGIPALWPLRDEELSVQRLGTYEFNGNWAGTWFVGLTGVGLLNNLTWELRNFLLNYNATRPAAEALDFLVAVVPQFTITGATGVNQRLRRQVIVVDEVDPSAAIHELAHGLGMYVGTEQYDYSSDYYPQLGEKIEREAGAILRDGTAFNPSLRWFSILPRTLYHYPALNFERVYDFLGCKAPLWITPNSLAEVNQRLRNLLGNTGAVAPAPIPAQPRTKTGQRRILGQGLLWWDQQQLQDNIKLQPETVSFMEVTSLDQNPVGGSFELLNRLWIYDTNGAVLAKHDLFYGLDRFQAEETGIPYLGWAQTFEVPAEASRYELRTKDDALPPLKVFEARSFLSNHLEHVTSTLDALRFQWISASHWRGGDIQPLQHRLEYRALGSVSWVMVPFKAGENTVEVPRKMLPKGRVLTFRLTTSDGFHSCASQVNVPPLANTTPVVTVLLPQPGDQGPAEALWTLTATAEDEEDGSLADGLWTSSLAGTLGRGLHRTGITLAAGTHLLTFTATDSVGASGQGSVTVTVGQIAAPNLRLFAENLQVEGVGVDPVLGADRQWWIGSNSVIRLQGRNQGWVGNVQVRLYVQAPGQAESVLAQTNMVLSAFKSLSLESLYRPTLRGHYQVRGEISALSWTDPNGADNSVTLNFNNRIPIARGMVIAVAPTTNSPLTLTAYDPDGDTLSWMLTSAPKWGSLSGTPPNLSYHPGKNLGEDSFSFKVSDGEKVSAAATVLLKIGTQTEIVGEAPLIYGELNVPATPGFPFSYAIQAAWDPTSYEAGPLPVGLRLDSTTGLIFGTLGATGEFDVVLRARNLWGVDESVLHLRSRAGEEILFSNVNTNAYNTTTRKFPTFTTSKAYRITRIENHHYAGGSVGTITLSGPTVWGPQSAQGQLYNGIVNGIWYVTPNIVAAPGSYTVMDSNPNTWAQNKQSDYAGFCVVKGVPTAPTDFTSWMACFPDLMGAELQSETDPDDDGLPNLIEYQLGTPPNLSFNPCQAGVVKAGAMTFAQLTAPLNTSATGLEWGAQFTKALGSSTVWTDVIPGVNGTLNADPVTGQLTVNVLLPPGESRYLRLTVRRL